MRVALQFLCALALVSSGCKSADFAGGTGAAKKDKGSDAGDSGGSDAGDTDGNDVKDESGPDADGGTTAGDIGSTDNSADGGGLGGDDDAACVGKPKTTTVKLLTPTVQNGKPGNFIDYEISVLNCLGKRQAIPAAPVKFDIDGEVEEFGNNFPYTLKSGGSTVSGVLVEVIGVDMFGNAGPAYFHNKTDQSVALAANDVAILHIDLQGTFFDDPDGGGGAGATFQLGTFLGFGDATPIKQDVAFTP